MASGAAETAGPVPVFPIVVTEGSGPVLFELVVPPIIITEGPGPDPDPVLLDAAPANEADLDTDYWDATAMSPLRAASLAAVARLQAYEPPAFSLWDRLPPRRRAAVLILLYPDRRGGLRVVITMRAAGMRSFPNQAALPGGKAESVDETPYETARREAWEEIGLPATDGLIPRPFRIRHLCYLPHHLARTDVVVRPCVALLDVDPGAGAGAGADQDQDQDPDADTPLVEETMIPRLDAREVAAVFSAPFQDFLTAADRGRVRVDGSPIPPPPGCWYEGVWVMRRHNRSRLHNFYVPVDRQRVITAGSGGGGGKIGAGPDLAAAAAAAEEEEGMSAGAGDGGRRGGEGKTVARQLRYKVWGMTAHILLDAARIAYGRDPEQEHDSHLGDEALICSEAEGWEWLTGRPGEEEHKM